MWASGSRSGLFGIRILIHAGQNDNQKGRKNHSLKALGSDGRLSWALGRPSEIFFPKFVSKKKNLLKKNA
jgi:hypothetical protein